MLHNITGYGKKGLRRRGGGWLSSSCCSEIVWCLSISLLAGGGLSLFVCLFLHPFLSPMKLYLCWPVSLLTFISSHSLPYTVMGRGKVSEQQCECLTADWGQATSPVKLFYIFSLFLYPLLAAQLPVAQVWSRSLLRNRTEGHHTENNSLLLNCLIVHHSNKLKVLCRTPGF